jgi:uncharacterized protein YlxP (DUF503 family)
MYTVSAKLTFYISGSQSLKDKRQIRRSLIEKTRQKFNVSIAEVGTQESHKVLTIGIAAVSGDAAHAQQSIDNVISFMDRQIDAELTDIEQT